MTKNTNNNSKKRPVQIVAVIIRWGLGGFFAMCALGNGFHYSSLFLLLASFFMFPLPFIEAFLSKKKIKTVFVVLLSVFCFIAGVISSPIANPSYDYDNNTIINNEQPDDSSENESDSSKENSEGDNTTQYNNTIFTNNESPAPDVTTFDNDPVEPDVTTSDNNEPIEPDVTTSDNSEPIEPDVTTSDNSEPIEPDVTTSDNSEPIEPDVTTSDNNEPIEPDAMTSVNTSTTEPSNTTSKETQTKMVWIPASGSKYHSSSSCSNMKSPRQVTLEYAESNGYEPCKRCH